MSNKNIEITSEEIWEVVSHRDFGTYDLEVMNGDGYYDEDGWYHAYV